MDTMCTIYMAVVNWYILTLWANYIRNVYSNHHTITKMQYSIDNYLHLVIYDNDAYNHTTHMHYYYPLNLEPSTLL
jgi:hypothetical protein